MIDLENLEPCEHMGNDILSTQGIIPFLSADKAKIIVHASLESTNNTAKQLAASGAEHGTTIIADHQTAGRGRYSRSFFSPPGHGIYMSIIFRPAHFSCVPTSYTTYAAVSVCEAIEAATGKKPQIKWVNDIFLNGKKICGILTETATDYESSGIHWVVIGIGINFSTPASGFPEDIEHIAGSIFSDSKPGISRGNLAAEIINRILNFENEYDSEVIFDKYKERLMILGKRVTIVGSKESFEAIAVDIDSLGHLVVKKDNGEILSLSTGEVRICIK